MIRDGEDKVQPEEKISKGESAAKVKDEENTQNEEYDDGLDDEIDDDGGDDGDDDNNEEQEQDIEMVKMVDVPARRSRRACSAVVNYKIDDSDGEYDDESDKENDPQEDDRNKDDRQDEEEIIKIESDVKEENSDFDPSQVDDEDGSEDEDKPEAQESDADESAPARGKKRMKTPAKPKTSVKKEEGSPKKKARVSEAVIQDAAEKMLAVLIQVSSRTSNYQC